MIRERFVLVLEPLAGVEPIRALRAALKTLLRCFGLALTSPSGGPSHDPGVP